MKNTFLLFASFLFIACGGQKSITTKTNSPVDEVKYVQSISKEELKKHLEIVASDEMEGRETGSAGQKRAGVYLIEQYKKMGIPFPKGATSYYQDIPEAYMNAKRKEGLPKSENIWAFIEGSEKPEEVVVLSAHYDHVGRNGDKIFNGADDDGSGTVALLEIAKAFNKAKKEGYGPKRSILIMHFTAEEHGLQGSSFYTENPIIPLQNTVADINIDMIGRRDERHAENNKYIYIIGSDYLSTELYQIVEAANSKFTKLELDYKYNDKADRNRFYYRSDHYNFGKNGIPSVFLFNGVHADYHKSTDTVDKIEFDALQTRTQLAFAIAWEVANRENKLIVDKIDK
jgi:Zn-dependent M28 family amino/carboxypeptidase